MRQTSESVLSFKSRMSARLLWAGLGCLAAFAISTGALAVPNLVNFQGRLQVSGVDFQGVGEFRFALVNEAGDTTYWSNDGSSTGGAEPTESVSITVNKGLYTVALGDTSIENMSALPTSVFADQDELFLRVWFDDGVNGSQQLTPDQRIAAVGYAITAGVAKAVIDGSITSNSIASGAVGGEQIAAGAVGSDQLADGSVTGEKLAETISIPKVQSGKCLLPLPPFSKDDPVPFSVSFPTPFSAPPIVTTTASGKAFSSLEAVAGGGFSGLVDSRENFDLSVAFNPLAESTIPLEVVDGRPAICYAKNGTSVLHFVISDDADGRGDWTESVVDNVGSYPSLVVTDGRPAVAYHDRVAKTLKFAINDDASGAGNWVISTVDSSGDVGEFASMVVADGRPAIAYLDRGNGDLKFAINANADGSGAWTISFVEQSPSVIGRYCSLALVDGRPAVAYYHGGILGVKYAINENVDGSGSWSIATVDTTPGRVVGQYPSLAVVDGRPAISYWDASERDLLFALSSNADGTGSWDVELIDPTGIAGQYSSLALVTGLPAIAYRGNGNGLKMAINEKADASGEWKVGELPGQTLYCTLAEIDSRPMVAYGTSSVSVWNPEPIEVNWIAVGE